LLNLTLVQEAKRHIKYKYELWP